MSKLNLLVLCILFIMVSACGRRDNVCPPKIETHSSGDTLNNLQSSALFPGTSSAPNEIEIWGKSIRVDQVVHGTLCDGRWSGTVYVDCDVSVAPWGENPTFLDDCNLDIEPGTVVYVAKHNNEAFYKGCSCHYTEGVVP